MIDIEDTHWWYSLGHTLMIQFEDTHWLYMLWTHIDDTRCGHTLIIHFEDTHWWYTLRPHIDDTLWGHTLIIHFEATHWWYTLRTHIDYTLWGHTLIIHFEDTHWCIKGALAQSGIYNSLQFLAAEQNPVWNKTWQYTPYLEKKKIIVQRRRVFSMLFPLARNKENGNIESRILS